MSGPSLPVLFVCTPLGGTRLTRRACGMRHLEAKIAAKGGKMVVRDDTCRTCAVGDKHASGLEPERWPDGSPIATATPSVPQPPGTPAVKPINLDAPSRAKRAVPVPAPTTKEPASMPPPRPITFRGRTQSISDWAREVRLTPQNISVRIRRYMGQGMSETEAIEQALTRPRDPKQSTTRKIEPTTAPARKKRGLPPIAATSAASNAAERIADIESAARMLKASEMVLGATGAPAKISKLPPPINAEVAGEGLHTPEAALRALGYDVTSIRVPAGLALIVREA